MAKLNNNNRVSNLGKVNKSSNPINRPAPRAVKPAQRPVERVVPKLKSNRRPVPQPNLDLDKGPNIAAGNPQLPVTSPTPTPTVTATPTVTPTLTTTSTPTPTPNATLTPTPSVTATLTPTPTPTPSSDSSGTPFSLPITFEILGNNTESYQLFIVSENSATISQVYDTTSGEVSRTLSSVTGEYVDYFLRRIGDADGADTSTDDVGTLTITATGTNSGISSITGHTITNGVYTFSSGQVLTGTSHIFRISGVGLDTSISIVVNEGNV